jgi:predicted nucleotidyltransferase
MQRLEQTTLGRHNPPIMIAPEQIDAAVQTLVAAAQPARIVVLFGSCARGEARESKVIRV